jgi:hypothetical protein
MKFKNKITGKIEEADTFTKEFAFTHNSNYEKVEEKKSPKKEED